MQALNLDLRNRKILHFCLCYAGVVALLVISVFLNLRKIPQLTQASQQASVAEIKGFRAETDRLDNYIRTLIQTPKPSLSQLQTIYGFIAQLEQHYKNPVFGAVLKSYTAFVGDLGNARSLQDEELAQLTAKYNQLLLEKAQLEQQLLQLQQPR